MMRGRSPRLAIAILASLVSGLGFAPFALSQSSTRPSGEARPAGTAPGRARLRPRQP